MINIANSESNTDCLVGTSTGRKQYEKRNRVWTLIFLYGRN